MRKLIVSAWVSIDGVFDAETMPEWYNPFDSEERQEYIRDGILAADAILFGRKTYEMLAPYWSSLKNNEMGVPTVFRPGVRPIFNPRKGERADRVL